jgi:glycine betaine/proline transport system substrate-binding protein
MTVHLSRLAGAAIATTLTVAISACGGAKVGDSSTTTGGGASAQAANCGTFNLAVNPWVGYEADAAVVAYVAQKNLGCTVNKKDLKEEVSWQGFGTGEVDAVLENWGHPELKKKYIEGQKTAVEAGQTGNKGIIGWYVPPWMAQQYPDITDWKNLNKYASMFKTSESGGKGQLLDGDPSYVTNDEALVKNLHLDFKVVNGGSETALLQAFRQAESKKTPLLAYFYDPQWFFSEMKLVKVNLPPYTAGCDAVPAKVACDYPPYDLDKIVSKKFADANGPAYKLVKAFTWTKMSDDAAAKKWVDANPDKVKAWLGQS